HALIDEEVVLGADVSIGPFVTIARGARIGARTIVASHVSIGTDAIIGEDCDIRAHVSICSRVTLGRRVLVSDGVGIGSRGFGYAPTADGHYFKIPQVGTVVIEDDVEIGASSTIDRASMGETRIGAGTKIDNLVQIAHSCTIGRDVILSAQVGLAGSTTIED